MKRLRGIGKGFACVLLTAGLLVYVIQDISKSIVAQHVTDLLVDQIIVESCKQALPSQLQEQLEEINDLPVVQDELHEQMIQVLGTGTWTQIEQVKTEIIGSKQIQELSKTYINATLDGIIEGDIELPNMQETLSVFTETFVPQLVQITGNTVSTEQIADIYTKINDKINVDGLVQDMIKHLHLHLSSQQKQVLRFIRFFNNTSLLALSMIMIGSACVLLILCTHSIIRWLMYACIPLFVSGLCLIGIAKLSPLFFESQMDPFITMLISMLGDVFHALFEQGCMFLLIGVVGLLIYGSFQLFKKLLF